MGFVLATCPDDSTDLAVTAGLEHVTAPVLVLPNCEKDLSELDVRSWMVPFKLLVDSTGSLHRWWYYMLDTAKSNEMLREVDSIVHGATTQ